MKKFKVITKKSTYNNVKSWKLWDIDNSFIQFQWADDKMFIIKLEDIESIDEV